MYFLIDFENVQNDGLRGAQYLEKDDTVIIFYSQACERIRQGMFDQLAESSCRLELCKLKKAGKNALDFYIATKLGAIFGEGYQGKAAIVSSDQGYLAVADFWRSQGKDSKDVILGSTIEQCILSADENRRRTLQIREMLKSVKLETEYARYQERLKVHEILEKVFADTGYEEQVDAIQCLFEKKSGKRILYLDSVKTFGKRDGIEIYRKMKRLIG